MGIHDALADVFDEVAKISSEIDSESMLELRNEVREAHRESSHIKREAEATNLHLTEMKEKLLLTNNQLMSLNEQLEAAKQVSASLQKKLDGMQNIRRDNFSKSLIFVDRDTDTEPNRACGKTQTSPRSPNIRDGRNHFSLRTADPLS